MQQGSSLAPTSHGAIIPIERKLIISNALGSATAMCRGIRSIAQLGLNEAHISMDDVECIFSLINELEIKLQSAQSEISA